MILVLESTMRNHTHELAWFKGSHTSHVKLQMIVAIHIFFSFNLAR
jgi:hypothetical protein